MDVDAPGRPAPAGSAAPAGLSRRRALGLAVLAPCAVLAGVPPSSPASPPPDVPAGPPVLHTRWSEHPDGPVPLRGDEGRRIYVAAAPGTRPRVEAGALVAHLPAAASATYVEQVAPTKIRRIGAVFGFEPGTVDGSLTLITWQLGSRLTAHGHVAIAPDRWTAATVADGALSVFASGRFSEALVPDRRPYRVEVLFGGDTAAFHLPDGTVTQGSSTAIAAVDGVEACWEFFRTDAAGAAVRLYEMWAG